MHRAYLFDPVLFHNFLLSNVIVGGRLSLDALYAIGADILKNANETTLQALEAMRLSPQWTKMPGEMSQEVSDEEDPDE